MYQRQNFHIFGYWSFLKLLVNFDILIPISILRDLYSYIDISLKCHNDFILLFIQGREWMSIKVLLS
jgi:hypothetical protein